MWQIARILISRRTSVVYTVATRKIFKPLAILHAACRYRNEKWLKENYLEPKTFY
jgi:hypothetical protein